MKDNVIIERRKAGPGMKGTKPGAGPAGSEHQPADTRRYLFDDPRNVKRLLRSFFLSLIVLLLMELFVHKHPYFPWEAWPEFYAVFGFVACVALVLAAKYILRPLVKRGEDYYD